MAQQKLYTEEQVREAFNMGSWNKYEFEYVIKSLTPIEIPSDEEIEKEAEQTYPISKQYKERYKTNYDDFNNCWKEGAKFMIGKILNK